MKTLYRTEKARAFSYFFNSMFCRLRVATMALTALGVCSGAQAQEPFVSELRAFAFNFCPKNWAPANGALQSIAANQAVFALMGTNYGGDGQTTFGLPDLRGRTPLGSGIDRQGTNYQRGLVGGRETASLTTSQMPAHVHTQISTATPATHATPTANALLAQAQNAGLYADSAAADTTLVTASAGSGQPFSTRDPRLAITWCVALRGVFPSSP